MILTKMIFPVPPSLAINVMSVVSCLSLSNAGWMEIKGKHMQYSKLGDNKEKKRVSSKVGMCVIYAPAFVAGLSSFVIYPIRDFRFTLVCSAVTLHFFKRLFEVLFVHQYSGSMELEAMVTVSLSYLLNAVGIIYNQHLMQSFPQPSIDLKGVGVSLFLLGIAGNYYHHYLLSKLRANNSNSKGYEIPRGGLFGLVICPHYLFEIVGFIGISCISQTVYAVMYTVGTTFYLMGRSYATRKWYESKFDDFPVDVKALFPYIF